MKNKFIKMLTIPIITSILLMGCESTNKNTKDNPKENISIVTSFYPMYILTSNITKNIENVEVTNLTKQTTGCLHDYSISTNEMKVLEDSDIFVINGANMESFMDKAIKQKPDLKIIEASKGVKLIEENPHVWLSISNAIEEVKNIEEKLIEYDPKNTEQYNKNAKEYIDKLKAQNEKMHLKLDNIENKNIITFHESFPYFAQEFNLNIVGVIERETGSSPSAKELQETIKTVKNLDVKAIFVEPQYPSKSAQTISKETGVKVYTLDPIVTGDLDLDEYINIMDENLKNLEEALK